MSIKGIFPIHQWDFASESVLTDLPAEDRALLMKRSSEHRYKRGEIIFREGAYPLGIYYIVSGKAKKYKIDQDGGEQIIYIANRGQLLGIHAVISEEGYPDSAAVVEEGVIGFIHREDLLAAIDQSPVLCRRILKTLSHEFCVLTNRLTTLALRPARERLALQLIVVREKYKEEGYSTDPVAIDISRNDLAALAGLARENVTRILAEFKAAGIIETRGRKIIVLDIKSLVAVANYR